MTFRIKDSHCPVCSKPVRERRQWGLHINGEWNESAEFQCGARLEYSPNFQEMFTALRCKKDPECLKAEAAYAAVREALRVSMATLPSDLAGLDELRLWIDDAIRHATSRSLDARGWK